MTEDEALLTLTQWLSPSFPVGGYAYSQGLETAIADGNVTTEEDLLDWLKMSLTRGALWSDAVLLGASLAADTNHFALSAEALARTGSADREAETVEQGAAFTAAHNVLSGCEFSAAPLPVAIGRASAELPLAPARIVGFYLQSAVSNLAIGAVRHIPLGQTAGQRILMSLAPTILTTATRALQADPADVCTGTPGADLAAMRHETQEVRIFRS